MTNVQARNAANGYPVSVQMADQPDSSVLPVNNTIQKRWRSDFAGTAISATKWDVIPPTGAMTYAVANGALTVAAGTTLDDELVLLSKETFTAPVRAIIALQLSQRIVRQTVFLELVSVDPGTLLPDEQNVIAWRIDGTSVTAANYDVQTFGQPRLITPAAVTIPTTTPPAWSVLELEQFVDEAWLHARGLDAAAARTSSYVRHQQIPDPNAIYRLRLRVRNRQWLTNITAAVAGTGGVIRLTRTAHGLTNGDNITVENIAGVTGATFPWTGSATVVDANTIELPGTTFGGAYISTGWATITPNLAPVSNTTIGFNFATVVDYSELTCEVTAGRGSSNAGQAIATTVMNVAQVSSGIATNGSGNAFAPGIAVSANPTILTTGRVAALQMTLQGQGIIKPYSIPELDWQYAGPAGGIVNTTDVVLKAAGAAGVRNYVSSVTLINQHASVGTEFVIKDGATVVFRTWLPPAMNVPVDIVFPTPLRGTAATAMNAACITTGAAVHCSAQGFQLVH